MSCKNERKHKNVTYHDESGRPALLASRQDAFRLLSAVSRHIEERGANASSTDFLALIHEKQDLSSVKEVYSKLGTVVAEPAARASGSPDNTTGTSGVCPARPAAFDAAVKTALTFLEPSKVFDKGNWKEQKICLGCCRPFTWRKKWERCWPTVYTCSDKCKSEFRRDLQTQQGGRADCSPGTSGLTSEPLRDHALVADAHFRESLDLTICADTEKDGVVCAPQPGTAGAQYPYPTGNIWSFAFRGDSRAVKNLLTFGRIALPSACGGRPAARRNQHGDAQLGVGDGAQKTDGAVESPAAPREAAAPVPGTGPKTAAKLSAMVPPPSSATDDAGVVAARTVACDSSVRAGEHTDVRGDVVVESSGTSSEPARDSEELHGCDVPIPPGLRNKVGWTPLHAAAAGGRAKVVELLLGVKAGNSKTSNSESSGAHPFTFPAGSSVVDIDARDNSGRTPLFEAARNGHLEACKLLVKRGCDLMAVDKKNHSVLNYCKDKAVRDFLASKLDVVLNQKKKDASATTPKKKKRGGRNAEDFDVSR